MSTFKKDKRIGQLVVTCDLDDSGYIDHGELASICNELPVKDLSDVFKQLDKDGDGRISHEEFVEGYRKIAMAKETKKRQLIQQRLISAKYEDNLTDDEHVTNSVEEYVRSLDAGLRALSCQEEVCELYQNLHGSNKPELVVQFENILLNVINDVRKCQMENERLEKTYRREKEEHDKHLRRMEDEIEQQVQSTEDRVRKQEKERLESEKLELRIQLDSEIVMLQHNLRKLQQDGSIKLDKDERLATLNKRLEDIVTENRMLKSELTDAHTNLALIKSQMTAVRHQLDEKCYELGLESSTVADYMQEHEKLWKQLHMLHAANKSLLDTNDNLRELLDLSPDGCPSYKRNISLDSDRIAKMCKASPPIYPRKSIVMNQYVDIRTRDIPQLSPTIRTELMPTFLIEGGKDDYFTEEPDSGHSTLRDFYDANEDTENDSMSVQSDFRNGNHHKKVYLTLRLPNDDPDSHSEMDTDIERQDSPEPQVVRYQEGHELSPTFGSKDHNQSLFSKLRSEALFSQSSKFSFLRRQLPAIPAEDVTLSSRVSSEPERMYRLVLGGDAAVGKSSFIVRLCQGKFTSNLSSTLGVDFQTKLVDVDGHPTALQLWDTAGQERFRSVAKTYFRRADGVLLLYDVTYERSFLNLREWVDAVEEGSMKKIPIMLIGNKTDARAEIEKNGRRVVKQEDGLRLSQEIQSLFIETSAKNGDNIMEAVIELTRLLRTNEDMEVKTIGLQLQEIKDRKHGSCCKRW